MFSPAYTISAHSHAAPIAPSLLSAIGEPPVIPHYDPPTPDGTLSGAPESVQT